MKKTPFLIAATLLVVLILGLLFLHPFWSNQAAGTAPSGEGVEYYTCPMHPSVIAYKPGPCPICGMTLVKKVSGGHPGGHEGEVVVSQAQRVQANIATSVVRRMPLSASVSA